MAQHRPSRIPFIAHFSDIFRSFSVVFGRFWSFFGHIRTKNAIIGTL
jgi:hypothetical protein